MTASATLENYTTLTDVTRLERSPGGTCTHWKAPPSHGARKKRSFLEGLGMAQFDPHGQLLFVGRKRQLSLLELDGRRQVQRANQRIVIAQPRLKFRWVRHKKKTARFRTTLFEPLLASQRADLFPARRKVGTKE